LLACCLTAFLPTHVYLATLGHSPMEHIKAMWTGWEEDEQEDVVPSDVVETLPKHHAA